jgi:hypothetical protein
MIKSYLVICLSACQGWGYGEPVAIKDPNYTWNLVVEDAIGIWNDALYEKCGGEPAFYIAYNGHSVSRLSLDDWRARYPNKGPSVVGHYDDFSETVDILMQPGHTETERMVLVHELGHALGLNHVDPKGDPLSVMHSLTDTYTPSTKDIYNVECP